LGQLVLPEQTIAVKGVFLSYCFVVVEFILFFLQLL